MINPTTFKRKFFVGFIVVFITCLVVGAGTVSQRIRAQERAAAQTLQQVRIWHVQLATELPSDQQQAWADLGSDNPVELLQACAVETSLTP